MSLLCNTDPAHVMKRLRGAWILRKRTRVVLSLIAVRWSRGVHFCLKRGAAPIGHWSQARFASLSSQLYLFWLKTFLWIFFWKSKYRKWNGQIWKEKYSQNRNGAGGNFTNPHIPLQISWSPLLRKGSFHWQSPYYLNPSQVILPVLRSLKPSLLPWGIWDASFSCSQCFSLLTPL